MLFAPRRVFVPAIEVRGNLSLERSFEHTQAILDRRAGLRVKLATDAANARPLAAFTHAQLCTFGATCQSSVTDGATQNFARAMDRPPTPSHQVVTVCS